MRSRVLRAVSLFSNCGAGDLGYANAGFRFEVMAELDARRLQVCLLNHPNAVGVSGDLRKTWRTVVAKYRQRAGKIRPALLAACPPCQGLSSARSGRGRQDDADAGSRDKRNLLVTVIAQVAKELEPDFIVLENVQAFLTRQIRAPKTGRPISAARLLIKYLARNYEVFPLKADLCDYGVPQTRKRTFLTFIRKDLHAARVLRAKAITPYPIPSFAEDKGGKPITLRRALSRFALPRLDASSVKKAQSNVGKGLHSVPVWRDRRYPMVAAIPRHTGGSAWQNELCGRCGPVTVGADDAICPECNSPLLRPVTKTRRGTYRLIKGFRHSSYSRMKSNEPAATITTASGHIGSDHTIHPFQNRLLSTLECARLQTFPSSFKWGRSLERWGHTNIREMVGEAVPPLFTRKHGKILVGLLRKQRNVRGLSNVDSRILTAQKKLGLLAKKHAKAKSMVKI